MFNKHISVMVTQALGSVVSYSSVSLKMVGTAGYLDL